MILLYNNLLKIKNATQESAAFLNRFYVPILALPRKIKQGGELCRFFQYFFVS